MDPIGHLLQRTASPLTDRPAQEEGPVYREVQAIELLRRYFRRLMMDRTTTTVETSLAVIELVAPGRMEVHFKTGHTFTVEGIRSMLEARQQLGRSGPHRVLIVMPDVVDFDLTMITTDHYTEVPQPNTLAVAWVVQNERNATFTHMYLAYFPPPFPSEVFLLVADGRSWLGW